MISIFIAFPLDIKKYLWYLVRSVLIATLITEYLWHEATLIKDSIKNDTENFYISLKGDISKKVSTKL